MIRPGIRRTSQDGLGLCGLKCDSGTPASMPRDTTEHRQSYYGDYL